MKKKMEKKREAILPNTSFKLPPEHKELFSALADVRGMTGTALFCAMIEDWAYEQLLELPKNPNPIQAAKVGRFQAALQKMKYGNATEAAVWRESGAA